MFYATQDGTKIDEEFAEEIIEKIHDEIDELEDKIESRATKQNSFGKIIFILYAYINYLLFFY